MKLPMLDPLAEIRRLYFTATRQTIERDFAQALDLLKRMPDEDERSRATVFMHGLAQMRSDWGLGPKGSGQERRGGQKRARQARPGAGAADRRTRKG